MQFISSEHRSSHSGAAAEREVWDRLKSAFGPDETGIGYRRYPIVDRTAGEFDREADFLLFLKSSGLVVIECKGYELDHIQRIEGEKWVLRNTSQPSSAPHSQAFDHGMRVQRHFLKESDLCDQRGNCTVPVNTLVALPNITREEWETREFHNGPSAPRVLLADDLSPAALREQIRSLPHAESLSDEEYGTARAVLSGGQPISGERGPELKDDASKGGLYETVDKGLERLDEKQEKIGFQIPNGPQRIRGIAGSGKTLLMAKKAAQIHAKRPDWNIALTFQTRSLYENVTENVRRYYAFFSPDDPEPDWNRLEILHGWGGHGKHGLYYKVAKAAGESPINYGEAERRFTREDGNLLHSCCQELLEDGQIQESYDAILIDEAQDFDPGFYKLCYEALRPPKRLIWAYDEAQNLQTLTVPTAEEIFGTDEAGDPLVDLSGRYEGGVQKSQIMRKAYRTPRSVLMLAHTLGMGLVREDGAVQAITNKEGWEDIGYKVKSGDFRKHGEPIELTRPAEHSPHPLADEADARPFLRFKSFARKHEEVEHVADRVVADVTDGGLTPEDVMVVTLGEVGASRGAGEDLAEELESRDIDANLVWNGDKDVFAEEGAVTISRINRAKGNQAAMVYVLGVEQVEDENRRQDLIQRRNEAFVAITRTEAWCTITGTGENETIFAEIETLRKQASGSDPIVTFPAPHPDDLEREMDEDTTATTIDQFAD